MKRGLLAACAAIAIAVPGSMSAAPLRDEVAYLIQSHPRIKAARNNISAREEGVKRAFSEYLPELTLFADYGFEATDSPGLRASRNGRGLRTPREKATLTLTQNLFDGFRRGADNETARLNKALAEIDLDSTEQSVLFEATAAYLDVLRWMRLIDLAAQNERNIQIQLNLEDERVQRGAGITVDVLQAKSRLQIAVERRVAFTGDLEAAMARFEQVFGRRPDLAEMSLPPLPIDLLPSTLEEAEAIALDENPAVANSDRTVEVARQRKRSARSPFYPRIDLVAEANYEDDDEGVIGNRRDASLKVQANWELFTGFSTRAEAAEAGYLYLASLDNHAFVNRKVIEDVRLSWEQLNTARERVSLLENAVNIASEVHEARKRLREAGKETALNVLDAENEVFNAQIAFVQADFDARTAVFRTLLSLGRLHPEVVLKADAGPPVSITEWAHRPLTRPAAAPAAAPAAPTAPGTSGALETPAPALAAAPALAPAPALAATPVVEPPAPTASVASAAPADTWSVTVAAPAVMDEPAPRAPLAQEAAAVEPVAVAPAIEAPALDASEPATRQAAPDDHTLNFTRFWSFE